MKTARKASPSIAPTSGRHSVVHIERRLAEILKDLARVLVSSGYGVSSFNKIAKHAYFEAAVELDDKWPRRKNYARIAAASGLTRQEVSQLDKEEGSPRVEGLSKSPTGRAHRVSMAWVTDPKYCAKSGQPNLLPFSGRTGSFESLVKEHSGDIPARAMLSEMLRLGMTKEDPSNLIRLVRVAAPISRRVTTTLGAISPWTSFLTQDSGLEDSDLNANSVRIELAFDSLPQLFAAVRELQERASAFVNSVYELGNKPERKNAHKLTVSVALGTRTQASVDSTRERIAND